MTQSGHHAPNRAAEYLRARPVRSDEAHSVIANASVAGEVMETLRTRRASGVLRQGAIESSVRLLPPFEEDVGLELTDGLPFDDHRAATLRLSLYDVLFVLDGHLVQKDAGWTLQGPIRIACVNRRGTARLPLPPGAATLCSCDPASSRPEAIRSSITDSAIDGVGVTVTGARGLPPSGFPALVELGRRAVPCYAEVRHHTRRGSVSHYGLTLRTSLRQALVDGYLEHRFPELRDRADIDRARVHQLLEASGYLGLRTETLPPEAWFSLPETKSLSRDVCYVAGDGALVGHFSLTRAYSKAWLGHQMATIKGHPSTVDCRRSLYLHVAAFATLMDGEETTVLGYFDREKPWHKIFFHDFVDWVGDPSLAVIAELDRFERTHPGPVEELPLGGVVNADVGAPSPEELVVATALIRDHLPELVAESLDIRPDTLESASLHEAYRGSPYLRERHVRVLRIEGKVAGVALCEMGSRELSLFNLFNAAFFFFPRGSAAPDRAAQLALLRHVRGLYAARGEHNPLVVAPPGNFDATAEPGTVLAETMGLIAKSGRSLRQYESFIKYQFGKYVDRPS